MQGNLLTRLKISPLLVDELRFCRRFLVFFTQFTNSQFICQHFFSQLKYAKISSAINGNVKKGVIFSTYSALIGETSSTATKYRTRLKQLLQWCGEDFDGCVSFYNCILQYTRWTIQRICLNKLNLSKFTQVRNLIYNDLRLVSEMSVFNGNILRNSFHTHFALIIALRYTSINVTQHSTITINVTSVLSTVNFGTLRLAQVKLIN